MFPKDEQNRLIEQSKQLYQSSNDVEVVLRYLRDETNNRAVTYVVLIEAIGMSPQEAKKTIHYSKTWADTKPQREEFSKSVNKALDEMKK